MSSLRAPLPLKLSRSAGPATPPALSSPDPYSLPQQNPSLSAFGRSISADAVPTAHLQVGDSRLTTQRPTPSPPFRLMPPSQANSQRSPSPVPHYPEAATETESEFPNRDADIRKWADGAQRPSSMRYTTEYGRLREELRSRPLQDSAPGRQIVSLLTYAWVTVPSGLAATYVDMEAPQDFVVDCARNINDLGCGAQAHHNVAAGILAIQNLAALNRVLTRCGLSPIQCTGEAAHWPPLKAHQPPDFLLEQRQATPSRQPSPRGGA